MKVLCVCGLGQGTSLLLKMNVSDVLKQLGKDADVENTDLSSAGSLNPDLIVTNSEFKKQLKNDVPVVIVENYFDKNEIKDKLERYFNN